MSIFRNEGRPGRRTAVAATGIIASIFLSSCGISAEDGAQSAPAEEGVLGDCAVNLDGTTPREVILGLVDADPDRTLLPPGDIRRAVLRELEEGVRYERPLGVGYQEGFIDRTGPNTFVVVPDQSEIACASVVGVFRPYESGEQGDSVGEGGVPVVDSLALPDYAEIADAVTSTAVSAFIAR
jgi:hypothetical protein